MTDDIGIHPTNATVLGKSLIAKSLTAAVRTPDGVIEFPTIGPATLVGRVVVSIPTDDGVRTFAQDGDVFRELPT